MYSKLEFKVRNTEINRVEVYSNCFKSEKEDLLLDILVRLMFVSLAAAEQLSKSLSRRPVSGFIISTSRGLLVVRGTSKAWIALSSHQVFLVSSSSMPPGISTENALCGFRCFLSAYLLLETKTAFLFLIFILALYLICTLMSGSWEIDQHHQAV